MEIFGDDNHKIIFGDSVKVLKTFDDNSIDFHLPYRR